MHRSTACWHANWMDDKLTESESGCRLRRSRRVGNGERAEACSLRIDSMRPLALMSTALYTIEMRARAGPPALSGGTRPAAGLWSALERCGCATFQCPPPFRAGGALCEGPSELASATPRPARPHGAGACAPPSAHFRLSLLGARGGCGGAPRSGQQSTLPSGRRSDAEHARAKPGSRAR